MGRIIKAADVRLKIGGVSIELGDDREPLIPSHMLRGRAEWTVTLHVTDPDALREAFEWFRERLLADQRWADDGGRV